MRSRRAFLSSGAFFLAALWGLPAPAAERMPRVGILAQDLQPGLLDAFRAGLRDFGYEEGRNVSLELRNATGHNDRLPGMAAELVALKVDVILAINTPSALAAKRATDQVPIVIMRVADPVKSGLVASIARPGGNVTGLFFMLDEFGAKGLELLREVAPGVSRIGILYTAQNPASPIIAAKTEQRLEPVGFEFVRLPVRDSTEIAAAFKKAGEAHLQAIFVIDDGTMTDHRHDIIALATQNRLPVVSIYKDFAEAGAFIAFGPNLAVFYRRAAYYVDRVLKGRLPSDLPIEQPTKLDLVLNLKAAKALGLTVPTSMLLRADDVIE